MNATTEFFSKSLVAAGVFLAVPAALSLLVVGASAVFGSPFFTGRLPGLSDLRELLIPAAWVWFCLLGFFLLRRLFRFVRTAELASPPRWLFPAATTYLLVLFGACAAWLFHTYGLARAGEFRDMHGDEISTELLVWPALASLLPLYALVLSFGLWISHALNRDA